MDSPYISPALVLFAVLAVICAAAEIGFRLGRRDKPRDDAFKAQLGVIRNATFAMLAFLIGFSFSAAGTRYIDRLDLVVKEANAIGTAYLRADVLAEPHRGDLRDALRRYADDRLALLNAYGGEAARLLSGMPVSQARIWNAALQGVKDDPRLMRTVLPPVNDVIDLHTTHLSAARRHTPEPILIALIGCAALAFGLVGFSNGVGGRRFPVLTGVYGAVIVVSLWMTIDLDRPRHGFIRVSQQPFVDLIASLGPPPSSNPR